VGNETIGVRVAGVSKRYTHRVKGEIYAAREVVLDVRPGEFLTLLWPSGCGKTTTLRIVAGFEMPDAGRVYFGGEDVTAKPANQRNIGFVFQNYALFPHLSIFENVAYGLRVRGADDREIGRAVGDVLSLVGLAGYEQQFSAQLSGGEQQRVALARAFVVRPALLLADEPTGSLDFATGEKVMALMFELNREAGTTLVLVTHDAGIAARCDRQLHIEAGRLLP
jgi:ABC-type Fe3+/spermidine/putrescine transport system ATPase subunit